MPRTRRPRENKDFAGLAAASPPDGRATKSFQANKSSGANFPDYPAMFIFVCFFFFLVRLETYVPSLICFSISSSGTRSPKAYTLPRPPPPVALCRTETPPKFPGPTDVFLTARFSLVSRLLGNHRSDGVNRKDTSYGLAVNTNNTVRWYILLGEFGKLVLVSCVCA